jgi:hypothetical protein
MLEDKIIRTLKLTLLFSIKYGLACYYIWDRTGAGVKAREALNFLKPEPEMHK